MARTDVTDEVRNRRLVSVSKVTHAAVHTCATCGEIAREVDRFCRGCGLALEVPNLPPTITGEQETWTRALAELYLDNAFAVLGPSVTATQREARTRARERVLQLELAGADPLDLQRMRRAEAILDDPKRRLREEVYATHLSPGLITELDFRQSQLVEAAVAEIRARSDSGDDAALHDLAILGHTAAILCHSHEPDRWRPALEAWRRTWESEAFWLRMRLRAEELADPRANEAALAEVRRGLPRFVLDPSQRAAAHFLDAGATGLAAQHASVIIESGFPVEAVGEVRAAVTARPRVALRNTLVALRNTLSEPQEPGAPPGPLLIRVATSARQEAVPLALELGRVDPSGPEVQVSLEQAAEFLRGLSVRLHNEANYSHAAWELIRLVLQLALPETGRVRYEADERTLRFHVRLNEAIAAAQQGLFADAIRAANEARELAQDGDQAGQIDALLLQWRGAQQARSASPTSRSPASSSGVPRWVWGLGFALVLAVVRAASTGAGSTGKSPTSIPTFAAPARLTTGPILVTPAPPAGGVRNPSATELQQRLDVLKRDLDQMEPELTRRQSALDLQKSDLDSQRAHMQEMERQYPDGAPPDIVSEYERLRSQFNANVDSYNRGLASVKSDTANYNAKVDEYNRVLTQYRNTR